MADGTIAAAASTEHAHKQERALNAEVTALSLACGALFPVLGYDGVLALVFGLPGVPARPDTPVPTGPAYSKARARSGEAPARAMFFRDAARDDIPAGDDGFAFGLEVTATDGTTLKLFSDPGAPRHSACQRPARNRCSGWSACCTPPPAAGRRRRRPLPRRGERPGRRTGRVLRAGAAEPRRPRVLLHGPLDPASPLSARISCGGSRTARNPSPSRS